MAVVTDTNIDVQSSDEEDPHAPKLAADDPRLRVQRPPSRVLKMGPVLGAIAAIVGLGGYAVLASVHKTKDASFTREPTKVPVTLPAVPAFIQQAPSTPEVLPPPIRDVSFAPTMPPPRAAFEAPVRPDPREQQALQQELARQAELVHAEAEARTSSLFFASSVPPGSAAPPPLAAALPPAFPGLGLAGMAPTAPQNVDAYDPNLQARKNAFLDNPRAQSDYLPTTLQHPLSPYEVKAVGSRKRTRGAL